MDDERGTEQDVVGHTYRLRHPVRYAVTAAVLAGIVAAPLDVVLFGQTWGHAWRVGVSSAVTWFVVLLVMAYSQRVKMRG